jgi:hypothetical protein
MVCLLRANSDFSHRKKTENLVAVGQSVKYVTNLYFEP